MNRARVACGEVSSPPGPHAIARERSPNLWANSLSSMGSSGRSSILAKQIACPGANLRAIHGKWLVETPDYVSTPGRNQECV